MAHKTIVGNKTIVVNGEAICIQNTPSLKALDRKLTLVCAALGKKKGDVVARALDEYLTREWAKIIKSYNEDEDNS